MRFSKLISDGTINELLLPQFRDLIPNLRTIFYEDSNYNIHVEVIYKENLKTPI